MTNFMDIYNTTDFDDNSYLNETYLITYISYFDHFLTEDEFSKEKLACYAEVEGDAEKLAYFKTIESKFILFYKELYDLSSSEVFVTTHQLDSKRKIISDYKTYKKIIINAVKEFPLCSIAFPSLNLCTLTGYDFTHEFYILKQDGQLEYKMKDKLEAIANFAGLHLVE